MKIENKKIASKKKRKKERKMRLPFEWSDISGPGPTSF